MKFVVFVAGMLISTISHAQWDFSSNWGFVKKFNDDKALACADHKHLISTLVQDRVLRNQLLVEVNCDQVFQEHIATLSKIKEDRKNNSPEVLRQQGFIVCEKKGDVIACK